MRARPALLARVFFSSAPRPLALTPALRSPRVPPVTLVFPTSVDAAAGGVVSLDWIAGSMRYQIDRKFDQLDGSLSSLELTEIQKEDAEKYVPDFPHQGGAAQPEE